jgi:hypothetical protein
MAANVERCGKDLDRLVREGDRLLMAMGNEVNNKNFEKQGRKQLGSQQSERLLKMLPKFRDSYEAWYSESLFLLRQLLPDRVTNFRELYEKPKGRKSINHENYVIQDYLQGRQIARPSEGIELLGEPLVYDSSAALPQFQWQLSILKAAKRRFESSLFDIRQLVQADLFDSEIDAARELLNNKFLRAAGAVAGVVLEKHLRQVCDDRSIKVTKKHPGISDLNELLKQNSAIDVPQWRHISMLADIRNLCAHDKQKEPTHQQMVDLIDGTDKVLKTIA